MIIPLELWAEIFTYLDDRVHLDGLADLVNCTLVSRAWSCLALRQLWKTLHLSTSPSKCGFLLGLERVPVYSSAVRKIKLEIDAEHDQDNWEDHQRFLQCLAALSTLLPWFTNVSELKLQIWCQTSKPYVPIIGCFINRLPALLPTIRHLTLADTVHVSEIGLQPAIFELAINGWSLRLLNLENTYMELKSEHLKQLLSRQHSLKALVTPECFFGSTEAIVSALSVAVNLRVLIIHSRDILSGVDFGVLQATAISHLSTWLPNLQVLELTTLLIHKLPDDGHLFLNSLSKCQQLLRLRLELDFLDLSSSSSCQYNYEFPLLESLDLSDTESNTESILSLASRPWPRLRHLSLPNHTVSPNSLSVFLENAVFLQQIRLGHCESIRISDYLMDAFTLQPRPFLKRIEVVENLLERAKHTKPEIMKRLFAHCPKVSLWVWCHGNLERLSQLDFL